MSNVISTAYKTAYAALPNPTTFFIFDIIMILATLLGAVKLLAAATSCFRLYRQQSYQKRPGALYKEYGRKSESTWALITGGTEPIGFAMAQQLASEGFNICIVSRSEESAKAKLAQIKSEHSKVQTKCIVADFSTMTSLKDYRERIADKVRGLDVGVVVANAGAGIIGPFEELEPSEVETATKLNVLHPAYTVKALVGQLVHRHETTGIKAAIVVTSSGLAGMKLSGLSLYCSAKAFDSFLAEGLNYELDGKVDVISY